MCPQSEMGGAITRIGSAKYRSNADFTAGFHRIEITPELRHRTAFFAGNNLYEYNSAIFGLVSSGSGFNTAMLLMISDMGFMINYIDDVMLLSESEDPTSQMSKTAQVECIFTQHVSDIATFLSRVVQAGMKLHPKLGLRCSHEASSRDRSAPPPYVL